jgi:hypothetical protein
MYKSVRFPDGCENPLISAFRLAEAADAIASPIGRGKKTYL